MFIDRAKFRIQFLKRVTKRTILLNYFKIWQAVSEEKNFEEFLWSPHSEKSLPHGSHSFQQIKYSRNFWKGSNKEQSCEIIPNSDQRFQRRFFKNFFMSIKCKKSPPHGSHAFPLTKISWTFWKGSPKEHSCEIISKSDQGFLRRSPYLPPPNGGHVFWWIKISRTIFKKGQKGHPRNNLVKLFQILTSGFGKEEFLRISLCPYSAKSLPPTATMFFDGSKFCEQFSKRVTQ